MNQNLHNHFNPNYYITNGDLKYKLII